MNTLAMEKGVGKLDVFLLFLVLLLTTIGVLTVFDASYPILLGHHSVTKFAVQQAVFAVIGFALMILASRFGYWRWRKLANGLMLVTMIMLVAVFVSHVGVGENGSHRWIGRGTFKMQPSELAKLAIVIYVAKSCAGKPRGMRHFLIGPAPSVVAIVLFALLIAKEPDLGTSLLIAGTGFAILFFGGMKPTHVFVTVLLLASIIGVFAMIKPPTATKPQTDITASAVTDPHHEKSTYQFQRIMTFLHPEKDKLSDGFQVYRSTLALGTGGITGQGIGMGREKLNLPEAYTDFIFAVIGEEGGFVASMFIILLYGMIIARGVQIACSTKERFGALMASGISFSIAIQALVNICTVTGSMPATGVPLPGISYGGTSLIMTLLMTGILLNIGRFPEGNPASMKDPGELRAEREYNRRWHGVDDDFDYSTPQVRRQRRRTATRMAR